MEQDFEIVRQPQVWGRSYIVTRGSSKYVLPSVTTILKLLTEVKWEPIRKKFGEAKWQKILDDASYRGTVMHSMLEYFLLEYAENRDVDQSLLRAQNKAQEIQAEAPSKKALVKIGRNLFWNFYHDEFWKPIKRVLHNEVFLWTIFKGGWAGACDFIYEDWNEDHIVVDFKSSSEIKSEDDIESYFCQIASYMFMYAERYGKMPARGEIWIANEKDESIQKFILLAEDMKPRLRKFLSLLEEFQIKYEITEKHLAA